MSKAHFHYVVIDTNALIDTGGLRSAAVRLVREARQENAIRLVVPQVVRIEYREHLRRDLERFTTEAKRARRQIAKLVDGYGTADDLDVAALTSRGMEQFEARCCENSIEFLPVPKADLEDVVERVASRRPPVDAEGRGLGDTVIWLTTLELLNRRDAHRVTLVTADGDFVAGDSLKPALLAEAAARGAGTRLKHVRDIKALPSAMHLPTLDLAKLEWVRRDSAALGLTINALRLRAGLSMAVTLKELALHSAFKGDDFAVAVASASAIAENISWPTGSLFDSSPFHSSIFDSAPVVSRERLTFQVALTVGPDGTGPIRTVEVWGIQQRTPMSVAEMAQFELEAAIDPPFDAAD